MTGTLSYDLPQEDDEFRAACEGMNARCALRGIDEWLRGQTKYHDLTAEEYEAFTEAREKLHDLLSEWDINLDW
jgi:hypothetical protein